jgi:hypothetical protein
VYISNVDQSCAPYIPDALDPVPLKCSQPSPPVS